MIIRHLYEILCYPDDASLPRPDCSPCPVSHKINPPLSLIDAIRKEGETDAMPHYQPFFIGLLRQKAPFTENILSTGLLQRFELSNIAGERFRLLYTHC